VDKSPNNSPEEQNQVTDQTRLSLNKEFNLSGLQKDWVKKHERDFERTSGRNYTIEEMKQKEREFPQYVEFMFS